MAINSDLQDIYKSAMAEHMSFLGDTVTIGAVTAPCLATVLEHSEEDPGGGDRDVKRVAIQCRIVDLTAGVPALHSALTYQGDSYKIARKLTSDDLVSVTFYCEEDL